MSVRVPKVILLGAGGHAKVVLDILKLRGIKVPCLLDDDGSRWGTKVAEVPVLGPTEAVLRGIPRDSIRLIIAIGNNRVRLKLSKTLSDQGYHFSCAIHPSAVVGSRVRIGAGSVVMGGTVINCDALIGRHVIVNTGATIDHDCTIEDYCHIAPGVNLCGNVTVRTGALLGVGSQVIPGKAIGCWSTLGGGSTAISDIPDNCTAVGTPARVRP